MSERVTNLVAEPGERVEVYLGHTYFPGVLECVLIWPIGVGEVYRVRIDGAAIGTTVSVCAANIRKPSPEQP